MRWRATERDAGFLESIRAAPDDDAPRLVYADYLLERGDRRGELIIAQCDVARLPKRTEAWRRAKAREEDIRPDGRDHAWEISDFVRGFPQTLRIAPRVLRRMHRHVATLPFRRLGTHGREGQTRARSTLGDLAWIRAHMPSIETILLRSRSSTIAFATRELAAIDEEDTTEAWPDDELPHALLRDAATELIIPRANSDMPPRVFADALPNLVEVMLLEASADEMFAFASRPSLRKLVWVASDDERTIGARIARAGFVAQLTSLKLKLLLDAPLAEALAKAELEELELAFDATKDGLTRLAESALMPKLRQLRLLFEYVRPPRPIRHRASLLARADLTGLEELRLTGIELDAGIAQLRLPALVKLAVRDCTIDAAALEALLAAPALADLYRPSITHCGLDPAGEAAILARWPDARVR